KNVVYTPDFMVTEINVDGNTYKCVLKDLQFDKVTERLIHDDFLELVESKKVIVNIPLKFTCVLAGIKKVGKVNIYIKSLNVNITLNFTVVPESVKEIRKLTEKIKYLKLKTPPEHLTENIEMDLTELKLNENVRVQDVKAPNMEILNSPRIPVASVTMTRQLK